MHVLHICAWYPSDENPLEGIFVERHIKALADLCDQTVWHIEARPSRRWRYRITGNADRTAVLESKIHSSFFREWLSFFLVFWYWVTRKNKESIHVVNMHIAHPNAVKIKYLKKLFKLPVVITEHHSAYHYSFGTNASGLNRTRQIFHSDIHLLTVSQALGEDIKRFSRNSSLYYTVVGNVVDTDTFSPSTEQHANQHYFMVAGWKYPKCPDVVLRAIAQLRDSGVVIEVRIGGSGQQVEHIRSLTEELGLGDQIQIIGRLEPEQVAHEMQGSKGFIMPSDYETFSVACAESLCCGVPVIASKVGGIVEFVNASNGVLVERNEENEWAEAIREFHTNSGKYDRKRIAQAASERFSADSVGHQYHQALKKVIVHEP